MQQQQAEHSKQLSQLQDDLQLACSERSESVQQELLARDSLRLVTLTGTAGQGQPEVGDANGNC